MTRSFPEFEPNSPFVPGAPVTYAPPGLDPLPTELEIMAVPDDWTPSTMAEIAERAGAETLPEALWALPGDAHEYASGWIEDGGPAGLAETISDSAGDAFDWIGEALADFLPSITGLLGGWPLYLLAAIGIKIAMSKPKERGAAAYASYTAGVNHQRFAAAIKQMGGNPRVNRETGIVTVPMYHKGLADSAAKATGLAELISRDPKTHA